MRIAAVFLALAALGVVQSLCFAQSAGREIPKAGGLTAVSGIKVGHHTLAERPTGCTVILVEAGAVAGVDVRGAAPGTIETDLLRPTNTVEQVHGIALSGGSAFGLSTASGVMRYLDEKHVGFPIAGLVVPIVPGAIIFDLGVGDGRIRPDAACGYAAAKAATTAPVEEGSVGAGAGATVGKLIRGGQPMRGGLGSASIELPNGLVVAALVVVNAVGNVVDPSSGVTIAGALGPDGKSFVDLRSRMRSPAPGELEVSPMQNTTLAVVATNATLTKVQATRIAQRAHDGYARALYPAHLSLDGDAIFSLATGTWKQEADVDQIGTLAADLVADAIVRGVSAARGIPGFPAARDIAK